jgi:hypothetical protein
MGLSARQNANHDMNLYLRSALKSELSSKIIFLSLSRHSSGRVPRFEDHCTKSGRVILPG